MTFSTIREVFSERNLTVLALTSALFMFFGHLYWSWWSLYLLEVGATPKIIGLMSMIEGSSMLLFQLPGGILADRFGRRKIILFGALFEVLTPTIYLLANTWQQLIPGLITSAFVSVSIPSFDALIAESLPKKKRAAGFGAYRMVVMLPGTFATTLGGLLMDSVGVYEGVRLALVGYLVSALVAVLVKYRYVSETLKAERLGKQQKIGKDLSELFKIRGNLLAVLVTACLSYFAMRMIFPFTVIYATKIIGLTNTQWGVIGTVSQVILVLLSIPGGVFADRFSRRLGILVSGAAFPLTMLGYLFLRDFNAILLLHIVASVGEGFGGGITLWGGGPAWRSLVTELAPPERRGRILGLLGTFTGLTTLPSSGIGGYIWSSFSPEATLIVSLILGIIPEIIFYKFVKED